jgi:DNA helicase-2/ATP-dependent DNA helicase PcrA
MSKVNYNPAQQEAIVSDKKYIRVIAGAGAGKTQVNSEVIAHKLNALGAEPEEILAITFSKNGATEIKDRAARTAGHVLPGLTATTFNALENEITLDNWEKFGFRHRPSVIDDVQDLPMCDILLRRHPILEWTGSSFKNYTMTSGFGTNGALRIVSDIMHHCSKLLMRKNFSAITYRDMIDDEIIPPASKELTPAIIDKIISFYPEYEEMKKGNDPEFNTPVITFDEQISYCMRVLENDPNYLDDHYDFAYIIVDEAQDTSEDQIEFLNHIINMKKFKSLIVVGDDSQAIYESLMGTSPDYLINLQNFLYEWDKETGIKTPIKIHDIVMDTNYRSVGSVIEMANRVIDKNTNKFDKQLVAFREYGEKPTVEGFYRKEDQKPTKTQLKSKKPFTLQEGQYDKMARDIKSLIDSDPTINLNDIAVLAYSKNELLAVADKLTELGIPSKFGAPEKLVDNNRVQAVLKFAHLVYKDPDSFSDDTLVVANALADGDLIEADVDTLIEKLTEINEYIKMIRESHELKKKELFIKMLRMIAHGDEAVLNFEEKFKDMDFEEIIKYCDDFEIYGDNMQYKRSQLGEGVMLITAHSSKGLEWKYVFGSITGFHKLGKKSISRRKQEELRRLLFVLITRARDVLKLYGLYAVTGNAKDGYVYNMFLKECFDALDKTFAPNFTK